MTATDLDRLRLYLMGRTEFVRRLTGGQPTTELQRRRAAAAS